MMQNDWIVAGLFNPEFTNADFKNIGDLTIENTQLLSKEDYLKSDFIKQNPLFRDEATGKFSEKKFTDYYNKRVRDFGEFQQEDFYQGPALDIFDIDRTAESPLQELNFRVARGYNPDRQRIGISGVNVWDDPDFSRRELAKQNKIYDYDAQQYKDYSVNDHTLVTKPVQWVKDLFKEPLVLATWEEEGEHIDPITGMTMHHEKGEHKLNDKGTYYYETLGGRSPIGKDVLSVFDTFTIDGKGINKYDFFDSNDIEKSVAGTIAKNVAAILPLFCGPVIGSIYAGVQLARELGKSMPMLYGMASALSDSENPTWINQLAAKSQSFSSSTSDYAGEHTFSFENFGNLVSDVALQWGQQKLVAQAVTKLKGAPNYIQEAHKNAQILYDSKKATLGESQELWNVCLNRYLPQAEKLATQSGALGRDLSLAYMAVVSNTDVYEDALDHGASKLEAAAVAFGSTLGMFLVDKKLGLGEIFFDEATPDATKMARKALKEEFKAAQKAFDVIKAADTPTKNKLLQYILKGSEVSKRVLSTFREDLKYHTLGMAGKMVGEGLEEVSEELVADVSKSLYELAGEFGFNTTVKDIGAWDNAFDRYAMSFLGGAVGGGVFYGKEVWDTKQFHKPKVDEDIATLIRNGHADELRNQLQTLYQEGKTGSRTLSATEYETDEAGHRVWKTTEEEKASQAKAVADLVLDRINSIEEVITNNRVGLTDDELFDNMVLSEKRYNRYKDIAQITNYYQDFSTVLQQLINDELAYKSAANTLDGKVNGQVIPNDSALSKLTPEQKTARQQSLDQLQANLDQSRLKVQDFLSGNTSLDYTRKLNFAMDPALHTPFLEVDMDSYLQSKYPGKTLEQLTPEEQMRFMFEEWPSYIQTQLKSKLSDAWDKFKSLEAVVNPHLSTLEQNTPAYKAWLSNMETLLTSGVLNTKKLEESYKKFNDKLDTETEDDYNNRHTKLVDPVTGDLETEAEFLTRRLNRQRQIDAYNEQQEKAWADKVKAELKKVNYQVDPMMARSLKQIIPYSGRLRQVLLRKLALTTLAPEIRTIIATLNTDLSNIDEVKNNLEAAVKEQLAHSLDSAFEIFKQSTITMIDSTTRDFVEYIEELGSTKLEEVLKDDSFLDDLDPDSKEAIVRAAQAAANSGVAGATDLDLKVLVETQAATGISTASGFAQTVSQITSPLFNTLNSLVSSYQHNPLVELQKSLKTTLVNPVTELIKNIAASNGDTITNIEEILETVQSNFENLDDASQLILNDAQRENLEKAKHYLELLKVYMSAASTLPNSVAPVGHNKTANEFARTHSDKLRAPWQGLPEIDADYATLYIKALGSYSAEIDAWIQLSDANQVNKIKKFVEADRAFSRTMWEVLSKLPRNFSYNGHNYDLLKGLEGIDASQVGTNNAQVPLYKLERLLYKNVQDIAKAEGLSVSELIQKGGLLETLVQGLSTLDHRLASPIGIALTDKSFTDFDKLQYIATILSEDPAVFYQQLQQRIAGNTEIAPLTLQEIATRQASVSMNQTFRDIITYAYSQLTNQETPLLSNTTLLFGVAGAGKTQVVLSSIDARIKEKPVLIAGPTLNQATTLQKALGRSTSMDFPTLLTTLLGQEQLNKIKAKFDEAGQADYDCEYFTITMGSDGIKKIRLKANSLKFQTLAEVPAVIYLDEATHLSTLDALIINEYAKTVGAQVFMCGDPTQRGYYNMKNGGQNIDEASVWAPKVPKLSISLRDNNLQKYQNQEAVRTLLEHINQKRLTESETDYNAFYATAKSIASKFNFKVYQKTELNGDLLTKSLDDATIEKLKAAQAAGKSIAFIGPDTSAHLNKLKNAGINIDSKNILSLDTMQGQEFDLVVIDYTPPQVTDMPTLRWFLQDVYTLMTRAREASIFIDNNISNIIGNNIVSPNKSKAPSIKSGVEELRNQKLDILNQLDFTPLTPEAASQTSQQNPQQNPQGNPAPAPSNPELDFTDPSTRVEPEVQAVIDQIMAGESQDVDDGNAEITVDGVDVGNFLIECYGDATYLGLQEGPEQEFTTADGKKHKATLWTVPEASTSEDLRNLQAIAAGEKAQTYAEKIALQRKLYQVKSAILFDHGWPTRVNPKSLPRFITEKFNQSDWENGTFELEFRKVSTLDTQPIWGRFRANGPGFEYGGVQLIANIVFKVKNKQGQICKFDLAGINNPDTLFNNSATIKQHLTEKLAKPNLPETTRKKLEGLLATWDTDIRHYRNWFNAQIDNFISNGHVAIDVTSAVRKNKTTIFRKRHKNNPIRLGGTVNPDNIDITSDIHNLKEMNPDKVFSAVHTLTGNELDFLGLDQSLAGRTVVFVSSDTLLQPEDLVKMYFAQKADPNDNTPTVRMLMVNPYGVTFNQLLDQDFMTKMGGHNEVPFRKNFMGIKMFSDLWNTRASLLQFTQTLESWKGKYNYTDAQVAAILLAQQLQYDNKPQEAEQKLKSVGLTATALDTLTEFNEVLCKGIPTYRLGYTKNGNGFHVQQFDTTDSTIYSEDKANLLVITPERAYQFLGMVKALLRPLTVDSGTSGLASVNSLNLKLVKQNDDRTQSPWKEDELIDLSQAKHRRSLAGLLTKDRESNEILVTDPETGNAVAYGQGDYWSIVPSVITKAAKALFYFQYNEGNSQPTNKLFTKVTYKSNDKTPEDLSLEVDLAEFFGPQGLLKPTTAADGSVQPDPSFVHMLDLIFHGTIEDIHNPNDKPQQLTDAYFKNGFEIHPELLRKPSSAGALESVSGFTGLNGDITFYEIGTPDYFFTVDADILSAGLQLSLKELLNPQAAQQQSTGTSTLAEEISIPTTHQGIMRTLQISGILDEDYVYDPVTFDQLVPKYNDVLHQYLWVTLTDGKPNAAQRALDSAYNYQNGHILTLQEWIQETYPESTIKTTENSITIVTNDGTYLIDPKTKTFKYTETAPAPPVPTEQSISRFDEDYKNNQTVHKAVMNILDGTEILSKMQELSEANQESLTAEEADEQITKFAQLFEQIVENSRSATTTEEALDQDLQLLYNPAYSTVLTALAVLDADLYNRVLNQC